MPAQERRSTHAEDALATLGAVFQADPHNPLTKVHAAQANTLALLALRDSVDELVALLKEKRSDAPTNGRRWG